MRHEKKRVNGELDFEVYHFVFETAMELFEEVYEVSKNFPGEKIYLTDQLRRHSKLVCTDLAEAWHLKENRSIFLNKLSDAAQAASKTQTCLEFASKYNYVNNHILRKIDAKYEDIFELLCNGTKNKHTAA